MLEKLDEIAKKFASFFSKNLYNQYFWKNRRSEEGIDDGPQPFGRRRWSENRPETRPTEKDVTEGNCRGDEAKKKRHAECEIRKPNDASKRSTFDLSRRGKRNAACLSCFSRQKRVYSVYGDLSKLHKFGDFDIKCPVESRDDNLNAGIAPFFRIPPGMSGRKNEKTGHNMRYSETWGRHGPACGFRFDASFTRVLNFLRMRGAFQWYGAEIPLGATWRSFLRAKMLVVLPTEQA